MYKTLIVISLIFSCGGYDLFEELMNSISRRQQSGSNESSTDEPKQEIYTPPNNPNLNNSHFCPLVNDQKSADVVQEEDYPWIARVFHSRDENLPFMCTAAVIQEQLFITAARCLATAKVNFTAVLYQKARLPSKAFVLPSNPSKQMFDDISIIIVHNSPVLNTWQAIPLIGKPRTDEHFLWFEDWGLRQASNTVVGFVVDTVNPGLQQLYKLESVVVSNYLCNKLVPKVNDSDDYFVPCYHHCSVSDHDRVKGDTTFERYLSGLGHAVLDNNSELIGIATWACDRLPDLYLPVGLSVPNSKSYYEDLDCALKIRNDTAKHVNKGYYQSLCDKK